MTILLLSVLVSFFNPGASASDRLYLNSSGSPLVPLLNAAKKSIDIEIYTMTDSTVQATLRAAVDRGVKVRIVQEPNPYLVTCKVFEDSKATDTAECKTEKSLVTYVRNHGGQYLPFNTAALCGVAGTSCFEHGKIVITDANRALISTGNFDASNLCDAKDNPKNCNRDYTVVTVDPAVIATLQTIFEKDLSGNAFNLQSVLASASTQRLTVSPLSINPLLDFIHSAKKTIQVQNQYLKDPRLNAALIEMANKGIKVYVMVSSVCAYGKPDAYSAKAWTSTYTAFDAAGVFTKAFTGMMRINDHIGYLHAKTILVDTTRAWVGSVNGSSMSVSDNREYGIFLDDAESIHSLGVQMYQDFTHPQAESWKDSLNCQKDDPLKDVQSPVPHAI